MGRGAIIVVVIVALLALGLSALFPDTLRGGATGAQIALLQMTLLAVLVGAGLFDGGRRDPTDTLGRRVIYGAIWLGIVVFLIAAYSQRDAFARLFSDVTGEVRPDAAILDETGGVTLRKAADGHFWAEVEIDGRRLRMMVDTGASTIALDPDDARALGIDVEALRRDVPIRTASGPDRAAAVRLESVRLGPLEARDVEALVLARPAGASLLGMSFLSRMGEVRVRDDVMRIAP